MSKGNAPSPTGIWSVEGSPIAWLNLRYFQKGPVKWKSATVGRPEFWRVRDCWLDRHSGIGWWESPLHHFQIHSLLEVDVLMYISEWFDMQGGEQEHSKSWLHSLHSYTMLASYLYKLPYHYQEYQSSKNNPGLPGTSFWMRQSFNSWTDCACSNAGHLSLYSHSSSNIRNTCALSIMSFRRRW